MASQTVVLFRRRGTKPRLFLRGGNANDGQLMDITSSQINGQQRNESYNYDQVARLTQASGFYAQRNYTYDRWANRTAMSGGSSQTVTMQQPGGGVTNNRIANVNSGPSYTYDAAGDVTYDAGHSYGYDAESRMVTVDSGSTATNFYDAANRRVKKVAGGYTTYYVWEGSKVIAEYGNAPVGSGGTRFYHPDRLSNRMITDASGVVKGAMDNLPFGEDGGVAGESEKHRFTSYERDGETSSDYAMNRQHSNSTGRFNRPDPVAGGIANPQSLNGYAYVTNDPVNAVDPLGLKLAFITTCTRTGYNDEDGNPVWFEKCETSVIWLPDPVVTNPIGPINIGDPGGPQNPTGPPSQKKPIWCQPDVIEAMKRAWARTGNGTSRNEAGFVLNGTPSNYSIVDTKSGNTPNEQKMTITPTVTGGSPSTFLLFHVHPNSDTRNPSTPKNNSRGDPNFGDTLISDKYYQRGQTISFLVGHRSGLTLYDPSKPPNQRLTNLRENLDWTKACK